MSQSISPNDFVRCSLWLIWWCKSPPSIAVELENAGKGTEMMSGISTCEVYKTYIKSMALLVGQALDNISLLGGLTH